MLDVVLKWFGELHLIVSSSCKKLVLPSRLLRGRMLHYEIYPLSFREFLNFKDIKVEYELKSITTKDREVRRLVALARESGLDHGLIIIKDF